jgi:SpoVK/Ycf46/Vps4 family AAA+-type ATPase
LHNLFLSPHASSPARSPQELDEAARRRFTKRIYVPLPDAGSRRALLSHALAKTAHALSDGDVDAIVAACEGYSGADLAQVVDAAAKNASNEGVLALLRREVDAQGAKALQTLTAGHFRKALATISKSVDAGSLGAYGEWADKFGTKPDASSIELFTLAQGLRAQQQQAQGAGAGSSS